MAALGVVGAIGADLGYLAFDLPEEVRKDLAVVPIGRADLDADDVLGGSSAAR